VVDNSSPEEESPIDGVPPAVRVYLPDAQGIADRIRLVRIKKSKVLGGCCADESSEFHVHGGQ
jgi:hypothetical protein